MSVIWLAKKKYSDSERLEAQAKAKSKWYHKTKEQRKQKLYEEEAKFPVKEHPTLMPYTDFFRLVMHKDPMPHQIKMMELMCSIKHQDTVVIHAGRASAKSSTSSCACLYWALEINSYLAHIGQPRNLTIIYASPQDSLKINLNEMIESNPELFWFDGINKYRRLVFTGKNDVIGTGELTIYNSQKTAVTRIVRINPSPLNARGRRCDLLICDEVASISDESLKALDGTTSGDISNKIYLSTPHSLLSRFNTLVKERPEGYTYFNVSSELCPWQKHTNEEYKRSLSVFDYNCEVHGRLTEDEDRPYFNLKKLNTCIRDIEPDYVSDDKAVVEAGIDFGFNPSSGTIYTAVQKHRNGKFSILRIVKLCNMNKIETAEELLKYLSADNPVLTKMDSRPDGWADAVKQRWRGVCYIVNNGAKSKAVDNPLALDHIPTHKELSLSQLRVLIQELSLTIPLRMAEADVLINQLKRYRRGKSKGDDYVDSLCFATYQIQGLDQGTHGSWIVTDIRKGITRSYDASTGKVVVTKIPKKKEVWLTPC